MPGKNDKQIYIDAILKIQSGLQVYQKQSQELTDRIYESHK